MSSRVTPWSKVGGVVAAVSLALTACGGSSSEDIAETSGRGDSAGVSSDRIADLRSSATLAEGAFQGLSTENQVCMLNAISEDDDLGDALIAGDESPPVQLALMRVLLGCDSEAAINLISGGDSGLDDFSEEEFTCLVDSMIADDEVLADAVSGSGALVAQVLLDHGAVVTVDRTSGLVQHSVAVGALPRSMVVAPDGAQIVTVRGAGRVRRIEGTAVAASSEAAAEPYAIAMNSAGCTCFALAKALYIRFSLEFLIGIVYFCIYISRYNAYFYTLLNRVNILDSGLHSWVGSFINF